MRELTAIEMGFVSGCGEKGEGKEGSEKAGDSGGDKGKEALPPAGTMSRPTRGESDWGERFNDAAGALNSLGSWIGISIYEAIHDR